jgi:FkbM family methyltransferase
MRSGRVCRHVMGRNMGSRHTPTLRRRLLSLLPLLGVRVADLSAGTVELSRSAETRVRPLVPGGFLVEPGHRGGRGRINVVTPTEDTALVTSGRRRWNPTMTAERGVIQALLPGVLLAHFDQYRVNCVIDVGGNRGQYAQRLRRAGYRGRIVSFEPVPEEFAHLQAAAVDDPEWSAHPVALGSAEGTLEMHVVPGTMSSPLPSTNFGRRRFPRLNETHRQSVPVFRLDHLLDEALAGLPDPRPFLKMDTQGFDVEVFRGLGDRAKEFVGLQSEVALMQLYEGMPRLSEALQVYEAAGFEVSGMYPVNRENRTGRVLEFDCLMVRADALG